MKLAYHRLVCPYRLAVRAVSQPEGHLARARPLALGREAERRQRLSHRLLARSAWRGREQFPAELTPRALDLAKPQRASRDAAREPPREMYVGIRRLATWMCVGRDRPYVARAPTRLQYPLALDQTSRAQPVEMNPDAAGMKPEFLGQLIGADWAASAG